MVKFTELLQERFRKKEKPKVADLAEQTSEGSLTVFSGIFGFTKLDETEKEKLSELLRKYALAETATLSQDLGTLISITSEVKAINNQAAILHGERIKRAQQLLLNNYQDGAFTAWLLTAYGNRQTPYNFLQYYEFYMQIPKVLHCKIEAMPRQAVYTLASRQAPLAEKEAIVRNYQGETKEQLLAMIRSHFPLRAEDKRREDVAEGALKQMRALISTFENSDVKLTEKQKQSLQHMLNQLQTLLNK